MEEAKDPIAKVDIVITHISDCILELDNVHAKPTGNRIPEMASALAALLNARTAAVTADNGIQQA